MAFLLRSIRTAQNLTIDGLAEKSGLSRGFISQIENGKRSYTLKTLQLVSEALGVGISDLFDDASEVQGLAVDALNEALQPLSPEQIKQVEDFARFLARGAEAAGQS